MSNVTGAAVETLPEIRTRIAGTGHRARCVGPIAWRACSIAVAISSSSSGPAKCWPVCCAERKRTYVVSVSDPVRSTPARKNCARSKAVVFQRLFDWLGHWQRRLYIRLPRFFAALASRHDLTRANRFGPEGCDARERSGQARVLRMLKSALKYAAIEKSSGRQLDDAAASQVIRKQVKQRQDSIESLKKAAGLSWRRRKKKSWRF